MLLTDHLLLLRRVRAVIAGRVVAANGKSWIVLWCAWHFACELLKSLALGLRDEEGREDTQQHEQREYLQDMVEPRRRVFLGSAPCAKRANENLSDDGANLSRGGRDTVAGGPVASWETFARHDEGGRVRSEVEEEVAQDVASEETACANLVVAEAHDAE